MFPLFGDGIVTQEGQTWKISRALLRAQLGHKHYEDLSVFRPAVEDLIEVITRSGAVVDLQPLFFQLTLDTTTAFLFGESVQSLRSYGREETFADAFNTAQEYVAKRLRLLDLYWLIGGRKFWKACDTVHTFADQIIDRNLSEENHRDTSTKEESFLTTMVTVMPNRSALRSQIVNLLIAGRDTTACLLSWAMCVPDPWFVRWDSN